MLTKDLLTFLKASPTAWHATEEIAKRLKSHGFHELYEVESWKLKKGGKYFVTRGGSTLCAFVLPSREISSSIVLASHTDSPALKLKPKPEFYVENMVLLGVEVYGGPLLSSWLNRDLGIAGEVTTIQGERILVNITDRPCVIPQLAIHLDREVNEKGLTLNPQDHISALWGLKKKGEKSFLSTLFKKEILTYDLFLYPLEEPRRIGLKGEFIASYRLDNLATAHALLHAIEKSKPSHDQLQLALFWDNEEIGSKTRKGADSPFLNDIFARLFHLLELDIEEQMRIKARSQVISLDLSHAVHPNYPTKHEPRHPLLLGAGIVLKNNAQGKYASDSRSSALITKACKKLKIPLQLYVNRTDIPAGSTVGPIMAARSGLCTVDIGLCELSMHSTRELMAVEDHLLLCQLSSALLHE